MLKGHFPLKRSSTKAVEELGKISVLQSWPRKVQLYKHLRTYANVHYRENFPKKDIGLLSLLLARCFAGAAGPDKIIGWHGNLCGLLIGYTNCSFPYLLFQHSESAP